MTFWFVAYVSVFRGVSGYLSDEGIPRHGNIMLAGIHPIMWIAEQGVVAPLNHYYLTFYQEIDHVTFETAKQSGVVYSVDKR